VIPSQLRNEYSISVMEVSKSEVQCFSIYDISLTICNSMMSLHRLQTKLRINTKLVISLLTQYFKPKLRWGEDDHVRTKVTHKKFSKDDLNNMDYQAYLACYII
jgi:hypothetical protein